MWFEIYDSVVDDNFSIDEITLYEGEWKDKNYAVSGDVLDAVSKFCFYVQLNSFLYENWFM